MVFEHSGLAFDVLKYCNIAICPAQISNDSVILAYSHRSRHSFHVMVKRKSQSNNIDGNVIATEDPTQLPRKKFFRQRAHANPFSDHALD